MSNLDDYTARREREKVEREKRRKIEELHEKVEKVAKLRSRARSMHYLAQRLNGSYYGPNTGKGLRQKWSFWRKDSDRSEAETVILTTEEVEIFGEWLRTNVERIEKQADLLEAEAAGVSDD
ncbi:hypothetical protein SEA_MAGRITTE_190 [Microbacterium phage Magritte]|nr:hypothetical protein SEA_MAGRITTE_190 [Microbacterium phage Magritte]